MSSTSKSIRQQEWLSKLERFKGVLEGRTFGRDHQIFPSVVSFLKAVPPEVVEEEKVRLLNLILRSFTMTKEELAQALSETRDEEVYEERIAELPTAEECERQLWDILPKEGFIRNYATFTQNTESPLAYHVFSSIVLVGAIVHRRLFFEMGHFRYFPPTGIIILGPSGIKKTSATNIMMDIAVETGLTKRYSEKLTPEALVEAMRKDATGVVYAPELSVLMGKQKYNEGLVPLITRFMDCPDVWTSETISRGTAPLTNIAISFLGCSTPDWFIDNTPPDTFGGGFVARILLVMQFDSPRVVRIPTVNVEERKRLVQELIGLHQITGAMKFSEKADKAHEEWYYAFKKVQKHPEHELLLTYYQRKPDHLIRMAMSIHLATHHSVDICLDCFERAIRLLDWIEQFLPPMFRNMFRSSVGEEQQYIMRAIRAAGGTIEHASLLRKVQHRFDATKVRALLGSLKEAKLVDEKRHALMHYYQVRGD